MEISLKLEGEVLNEEKKTAITAEDNMHREVRRKLKTSHTWAESSEFDKTSYPEKVLVMDAVTDFGGAGSLAEQEPALRDPYLTTVIFDSDYAAQAALLIPDMSSIREV